MKIAILGMGCATCNKLEDAVHLAVKETGVDEPIDHVKDIKQIMAHGVMRIPTLMIDGKVVGADELPSLANIKQMIGGKP